MGTLEMINDPLNHVGKEESFEQLYEIAFPRVAAFVSKMNGSFEDAKDIFQDCLVLFYEKTKDENFSVNLSEAAYILGIAKHLWIKKFKNDHCRVPMDSTELTISLPADLNEQPDDHKLLLMLEKAGKKCLDLLTYFYYKKLPTKEITATLGYRNEHSTAVQKFKCLEKIRDTVKEKALNYEDFLK